MRGADLRPEASLIRDLSAGGQVNVSEFGLCHVPSLSVVRLITVDLVDNPMLTLYVP